LTRDGLDFIKTALSPPDFGIGTFAGVPDSYDGRVITKSWNLTGSGPGFTAGADSYIVQLPVPGVAYYWGSVSAGALALNPVYYSDYATVFPTGQESSNISSFRYGGQAMEIIPLVNAMTWTGSVQVFRGQVELSTFGVSASAAAFVATGLASLINSSKPDAVHPFNLGCFCVSRQTQPDYPFHQIHPGTANSEINVSGYPSGVTVSFAGGTAFLGLGSMEAIVYKIPAYSTTGNIFTIRTWAMMECQVNSASALYEYAHISPMEDRAAMALVKKAFSEMQLCVPFYENEGLWSKILAFIKTASAAMSFVPGPVGEIAAGVGTITAAVETLVV
jgi:hypothetical protein